jgi:hypothetical protein
MIVFEFVRSSSDSDGDEGVFFPSSDSNFLLFFVCMLREHLCCFSERYLLYVALSVEQL